MVARLEITSGPQLGERRAISGLGSFTIGRSKESDLTVAEKEASRTHCRIDHDGEYFWLVDCQSRNGTFLNGRTVTNSLLYDGDVIKIGHTELVFHLPKEKGPEELA